MDACPHCGHKPPSVRELAVDVLMLAVATGVAYGRYKARLAQDAKVAEFRHRLDSSLHVADVPPGE